MKEPNPNSEGIIVKKRKEERLSECLPHGRVAFYTRRRVELLACHVKPERRNRQIISSITTRVCLPHAVSKLKSEIIGIIRSITTQFYLEFLYFII
ncbi:hypothetical protein LINGRAHAP2_LOCUS2845 [Linum grandiflorum]